MLGVSNASDDFANIPSWLGAIAIGPVRRSGKAARATAADGKRRAGQRCDLDEARGGLPRISAVAFASDAARPLLHKAGVEPDTGVIDLSKDAKGFLAPARTRQWDREPKVRMLA